MSIEDVVRERLQDARRQKRVSGASLGRQLGVTRSLGTQMINGTKGIPHHHFQAIAAMLGITPQELITPRDLSGQSGHVRSPSKQGEREHADSVQFGKLQQQHVALLQELARIYDDAGLTLTKYQQLARAAGFILPSSNHTTNSRSRRPTG